MWMAMISRKVRNVMTHEVITVDEQAPFTEMVRRMAVHKVSALPVVDQGGRLVGIVSEADLLHKEEYQDLEGERHWLETRRERAARAKAAGRRAAEVMSTPVVTIDADATVAEAARRLARHRVKRLPVLDEHGRLVGIVSRADLLRLYLRDDDAIHLEIVDEVLLRALWIDPTTVVVKVDDGVVTLVGQVESASVVPIVVHLTRTVPGVVDVVNRLSFQVLDDRPLPPTCSVRP
jgi:CBS-domain-containing membrane protein